MVVYDVIGLARFTMVPCFWSVGIIADLAP
jgi:hypothetical protein